MIDLAWKYHAPLVEAILSISPIESREAIARSIAGAWQSGACPTTMSLCTTLAIVRQHALRFERVFGHFGRTAFYQHTIPAAIVAYAEDPEFFDHALRNVLENGEEVSVPRIDRFFSETIPRAIACFGFDIYELRDSSLRTMDPALLRGAHEEADDHVRTMLSPADVRAVAAQAIAERLRGLETDAQHQEEDLLRGAPKGSRELPPFLRYSIERELDEERLSLLLPHLFHAKLSAETDPEEATALLELLGSAQQAIHRFADRALRIRSDVGLLIAEHGTVHADRLIKKYVETPSKAYSMLTRQHITQALHGVLEHIADEEALMEVRDPRAALGPETPGVLTEADIVLSRYDPPMMFHLPTSSIFGEHDQCRVRIAGPVVRVYDLDGRPRLRRRDTLPFGMRVAPAAITARGSLRGYIRVETDAHGALILDRSPSGKMIAVADVPEGTLPPESALTFECRGAEVRCSLPHGDLTLHVRDLREAAKRSREGVEISSANDVVLFKKVGCNIIFQAHGDDAAALGIPFIASRLAQVIHALEQTYPGKRLEYILPETLEVHAKPRHKLGAAAGSDQRGTTRLTVEDVHPAVLAAFLMHEDAHCLAAKVLGTIERYVAERFRGRRVFVGSKTPTEIVEEGVKEIFARLVQLRYLTDAVRGHAVTSQTVDAMVQELRSWILMDAEHFRSHDLLSERGVRLMGDFLAELADLEAAYAMDDCAAQEQEGGDDAEPLPYEIIRGGTRRAWEFFLSDLAEGMCTTALERYGLLPDPKRARIAGRAPLALPSPAASRLVSRESFVVRKKRTERIPKRNRSPQPSFSDYAAKHPEAWEQRASYREEWRAKVRDAKRMAGEESWDPDDDSDDD